MAVRGGDTPGENGEPAGAGDAADGAEGQTGGTGLGAYSARLIVENLGDTITFATGEAAGTTVSLSLPRPL